MSHQRPTTRLPISISGTVQVFCLHDQEKRKRTVMEFDAAEHNPNVCICCQNMFLTKVAEPLREFCGECDPLNYEKRSN